MAYNGSGVFTLVAGNPVVSGTVISATTHNNTMSDIANNGLSNAITKDGQTTITQNIPFNSKRITGLGEATSRTDAARVDQVQNSAFINLSTVAGTDTITATVTPTPSAYASGQIFVFEPAGANTGAATINISSLGAKDIYLNGEALTGGELVSGEPTIIRYNGTQFDLFYFNVVGLSASSVSIDNTGLNTTATNAQQAIEGALLGRKNLIINGNKSINQRSAVTNTTTSSDYNFDRWFYDGTYLYQSVEEANLLDGDYAISWDSDATCEYQLITTATSSSGLSAITTGWTSVANQASLTLTGTSGNNLWLRFTVGMNGLNALTGLQMERGTVSTSFEYRPIGEELSLCQRYYLKTKAAVQGYADTAGRGASTYIYWKQEMRVAPSVTDSGGTLVNVSDVNVLEIDVTGARFQIVATDAGGITSSDRLILADAEL